MRRVLPRIFATLLLAGGLALAGCQDSMVSSSTENAPPPSGSSKAQATPGGVGNCTVVAPGESIQNAIQSANDGDVICVKPGTYEEQVTISRSVTVRGQTPVTSGNPVVVDGWVSLDADGAALRRVVITREDPFTTPGSFTPDPFGVRITASNTVVADNVVRSISEEVPQGSINGIQAFGAESISDVQITDNVVRDYRNVDDSGNPVFGVAGIKIQANVSDVEVTGNEVSNLHSGFGFGIVLTRSSSASGVPQDVLVEENTVESINDGSVFDVFSGPNEGRDSAPYPGSAFGMEAEADEATVRRNNLLAPNGAENKDDDPLVAECNWWGERSGPTDDGNPGGTGTWALERNAEIEYTPWLNAPAPSNACIGGETPGGGNGPDNGQGGRGE